MHTEAYTVTHDSITFILVVLWEREEINAFGQSPLFNYNSLVLNDMLQEFSIFPCK